jgi:hypothetical protein
MTQVIATRPHKRHIIVPWHSLLFALLLAGCKEVDDLGVGTPCSVDADCAANEAATQCVTISVDETYCTMECEYPADCPWGGCDVIFEPGPLYCQIFQSGDR